jgi:glycosyltransferase involved in cell wall biosynthesis
VPHKVNNLTARQSSLKVLEYLAAGRPVVVTDIPLPLDLVPLVHTGTGAAEIEHALTQAALKDSPDYRTARQDAAARHSWDESFAKMTDVMSPIWA